MTESVEDYSQDRLHKCIHPFVTGIRNKYRYTYCLTFKHILIECERALHNVMIDNSSPDGIFVICSETIRLYLDRVIEFFISIQFLKSI